MFSPLVSYIIVGLFAIFLCIVIPALLYLRQMSMKSDIAILMDKIIVVSREYTKIAEQYEKIYGKVADVEAEQHAAKTRDLSTQETIRALSNKINSRVRAERKAALQTEVEQEGGEGIDFEQMAMKFPGAVLPMQPKKHEQEESPPVRQRRFGEMP